MTAISLAVNTLVARTDGQRRCCELHRKRGNDDCWLSLVGPAGSPGLTGATGQRGMDSDDSDQPSTGTCRLPCSQLNCIRIFSTQQLAIFRPHRSTTHVDAAYCYRPSSVVCLSVCVSVQSPAKTAESIEMPLALKTRVGQKNHVGLFDGVKIPYGKGNFHGKGGPL